MGKKEEKTNAMRILDSLGIPYDFYLYDNVGSADRVAAALGVPPDELYKTLVTVGRSGRHYVFMLRCDGELDLKKAAAAANEKNVEMLRSKELLPLTGYVHGGCSPVGMKKFFPTFFDVSSSDCETLIFSAGRIGAQIEIKPSELSKVISFGTADLCREEKE